MNKALKEHKWTQAKAAEMAGVGTNHMNALTRTIPEGIGAGYLLKAFIGVDVNPLDLVKAMGITGEVEKHLADPEDRKHYPTMARILGQSVDSGTDDPLEVLLRRVPEPKRELARDLIQGVIDTMNR